MARTKRKVNPILPVPAPEAPKMRIYQTAGYIRLSVEDSGKPGADTIEAQKELVLGYVEAQPDMEFCGLYCDNGRTGTNFERPGFERLMDEVRSGKVDCIVVKDLSRFGRNYKETGNYLEQIFPFLDVRFVAVNDSFDTMTAERTADGYIVPLKNIINEVYSKDIGRKCRSALMTKQQKGEFIGAWASYGYQKCAGDSHRMEPDPETAPVVREIFSLRLMGISYHQLTRTLNEREIPSPGRYLCLKGRAKCETYANSRWTVTAVKKILSSEVYLGHMVQGRKRSGFTEDRKPYQAPESEWVIVRNTHEPLIDEKTFRAVQAMAAEINSAYKERLGRYDNLGTTPNLLRGLVFCADCKRPLVRYKNVTNNGKNLSYVYICPSHSADPVSCPKKYLHETELKEVLRDTLQQEIALAGKMEKLTRTYLTVGNYISSVFPFLGVRFIAVNDGYDSIRPLDVDSLDTSFKTLLYDFYSRDLSRKVRSAKAFRAQRGDFLSPFAPYGFIKDPANKNRLLIDPPAAEIVRRIFRMMGSGHPAEQIAKVLNSEAVPTPMLYKRAAGCSRISWPSVRDENIWTRNLICKILRDERYIGANVYGKRMRDQVGHHHTVKVSKAEWITAAGAHEGIVTREEFDKAQLAMREFMERDGINLDEWVLRHKVRCGVCGYAMTRSRAKHPVYYCRTNRISDAFACPTERVPEADILEAVLEGFHTQAMAAVEMAQIWEERHRQEKKDTAALRKNIASLREAHSKLERQIKDLYTSFGLGDISKAEYLAAKTAAVQQRDSAAERLAELEAKLENTSADGELQNQFVARFRPYAEAEMREITQEILSDLLYEIRVYPGGRLEIIWNYRDEYEKMMLDLEGEHQNGA